MYMDRFWYCSVRVKGTRALYSYISDSGKIDVGSYVVVPFGKQNVLRLGEVKTCAEYSADSAPFPPEKTKHIVRIATAKEYEEAERSFRNEDEIALHTASVDLYMEDGDWESVLNWASFHHNDDDTEIVKKVMECYEMCIEQNMPLAALNLGTFYYNGIHVEKDYEKAFRLYKIAADAGELRAICNCGYCFYYGRHQERDFEKAYQYFSLGALLYNDANCLYKLGDLYRDGNGVEKNEKYAFLLYQRALRECSEWQEDEFCLADAQFRVGKCLLLGMGTGMNAEGAHVLLSEALNGFYKRRRSDPHVSALIRDTKVLLATAQRIMEKELLS